MSYVVGILDLDEVSLNTSTSIEVSAPIKFESRKVSRGEVDEAFHALDGLLSAHHDTIHAITPQYHLGTVEILTPEPELALEFVTGFIDDQQRIITLTANEDDPTPTGEASFVIVGAEAESEAFLTSAQPAVTHTNPYRAGKRVTVHNTRNCSTGFLVRISGLNYGTTSGHCGGNGTRTDFGDRRRGNIERNSLWPANPANLDASVYRMINHGTSTIYAHGAGGVRQVAGQIDSWNLPIGAEVCGTGASSLAQSCGRVSGRYVTTWSDRGNREVRNGWRWDRQSGPGITQGDSGGPVYRVNAQGRVLAVGLNRTAVASRSTSVFDTITRVLSGTSSTLATN